MILKRFVKGIDEEAFFQKRAPGEPARTGSTSPSCTTRPARSAEEVVVRDAAGLAWVVNLGCIDLNPHPVLAEDLDHPDELRIDLDPVPGRAAGTQIVDVALVAREVLADHGLTAWPKTSGSRGFHVYARIDAATGASARCGWRPRRSPARSRTAPPTWPPASGGRRSGEGVFVDFNQNAKDRTVASAYSVRRDPGRPRVHPAGLGRGARLPAGGVHPGRGAGPVRRARRPVGRDGGHRRFAGAAAGAGQAARPGREGAEGHRSPDPD